jgi:hypothetical protein
LNKLQLEHIDPEYPILHSHFPLDEQLPPF